MLPSNMLLLNLILLIDVTFSTPTGDYTNYGRSRARGKLAPTNRGSGLVRTYEDAGRSGLHIANRHGLSKLLSDVITGAHKFKAILVYDVSRWGRFQDADEAAHYECSAARRAKSKVLRDEFVRKIADACPTVVQLCMPDNKLRPHLIVDESIQVAPLIVPTDTTLNGHRRWLCKPVLKESKNVILACALDATNTRILSSYVWAPNPKRMTFRTMKEMLDSGFRLSSPPAFPRLVRKAVQLGTS